MRSCQKFVGELFKKVLSGERISEKKWKREIVEKSRAMSGGNVATHLRHYSLARAPLVYMSGLTFGANLFSELKSIYNNPLF